MSRGIFYRIPRVTPGDTTYATHSRCPQKWTATLSGHSLDMTCYVSGANSNRITAGNLNTSYPDIERSALNDSCDWLYDEDPPTSVTLTGYVGLVCGGGGMP